MPDNERSPGAAPQSKLDPRLRAITRLPRATLEEMARVDARLVQARGATVIRLRGAASARSLDVDDRDARATTAATTPPARDAAPLLHGIRFVEGEARASVLLHYRGDAARFGALGARVRTALGDIATLEAPLDVIERLEQDPDVLFIELTRPLFPMLDRSLLAIEASELHRRDPSVTGAGVVVGVIDVGGIDIHHPDFCLPNALGHVTGHVTGRRTRIAWLWDQTAEGAAAPAAGATPEPFGYGVEYSASDINAELAAQAPYSVVAHRPDLPDSGASHGTHVTGIAAGNGAGSDGTYTGVAPEAEIVFVNVGDSGTGGFADMARVCDALAYVVERAGTKPVAVNISLGDNLGPHDGTSLVERFIDGITGTPGRVVVVAAGNNNDRRCHAELRAPAGAAVSLDLTVPPGTDCGEALEIWYPGADRLDLYLFAPAAAAPCAVVEPGSPPVVVEVGSTRIIVTSAVSDARNGDKVIHLLMMPTRAPGRLTDGTFRLELRRSEGYPAPARETVCHAWIDGNTSVRWAQPTKGRCTLTTPASARGAIAVANSMPSSGGTISDTSGRGPTRDGRKKPDVAAPGQAIVAPTAGRTPGPPAAYIAAFGTSQSAPHVTGVAALLFQCRGARLDAAAIRSMLVRSADRNDIEGPWDPACGFGRVRAESASSAPVLVTSPQVNADVPATGVEGPV